MKLHDIIHSLTDIQSVKYDTTQAKTEISIQIADGITLVELDDLTQAWQQEINHSRDIQKTETEQLKQLYRNHWIRTQRTSAECTINPYGRCTQILESVAKAIPHYESSWKSRSSELSCWLEILIPILDERNARELSQDAQFQLNNYLVDYRRKKLINVKRAVADLSIENTVDESVMVRAGAHHTETQAFKQKLENETLNRNQRRHLRKQLRKKQDSLHKEKVMSEFDNSEAILEAQLDAWWDQGKVSLSTLTRLLARHIPISLWSECLDYFIEFENFDSVIFSGKTVKSFIDGLGSIQDTPHDQALVYIVLHAYIAKRSKGDEFNSWFGRIADQVEAARYFLGSVPDKDEKLAVVRKILDVFNHAESHPLLHVYDFLKNPAIFLEKETAIACNGDLGIILNKFFYHNLVSLSASNAQAIPPAAEPTHDILSQCTPTTPGVLGRLFSIFATQKQEEPVVSGVQLASGVKVLSG